MNRFLFLCLFLFSNTIVFAQEADSNYINQELFDSLLVEGVREFDLKFEERDFSKAANALQQAVAIDSQNARAHYYLAYAYSGMNYQFKSGTSNRNKRLTRLASTHMEKVIELDSAFGAPLALSPYSKISSEWGALALSYLDKGKIDSVKWALQEGRRRKGFSPFLTGFYKTSLKQCPSNAILFSYGDDSYWNIMYVQYVEGYRADVAVVDIGMLNVMWYQQMLNNQSILVFDVVPERKEKYFLVPWSDTLIEVPIKNTDEKFSWSFESRGSNPYFLSYGDAAIKRIITNNQFQRAVLFTIGMPKKMQYNLFHNFEDHIVVSKFSPQEKSNLSTKAYNQIAKEVLQNVTFCNTNSIDENRYIDNIRIAILSRVYQDWSSPHDKKNAKFLLKLLDKRVPPNKYPYSRSETKQMVKNLKLVVLDEY